VSYHFLLGHTKKTLIPFLLGRKNVTQNPSSRTMLSFSLSKLVLHFQAKVRSLLLSNAAFYDDDIYDDDNTMILLCLLILQTETGTEKYLRALCNERELADKLKNGLPKDAYAYSLLNQFDGSKYIVQH